MEYFFPVVMSSVFVLEGGGYEQNALTMPPLLIGVSALMIVGSNLSFSVTIMTLASYITQLIPALVGYEQILGIVIATVFFALSIKGTKFISRIQNVMVVMMYAALALFVIFGIINFDGNAFSSSEFLPQGVVGFAMAVAMMSFTCAGSSGLPAFTKDSENPKQDIPRAMILSSVIGGIIYALLAFAAICALPYDEISGQNLGFIAQRIMPSGLYLYFIIGGAIFALATTVLGNIGGMKWPIFAVAKDGWLPSFLTKETKNGFPWVVMLMMYLITVIPIIGNFTLESIVSLIMVPAAVVMISCNISNWRLPERFPKAWSENSLHLSPTAFRILMALSTTSAIGLSLFSMSGQPVAVLVANVIMCGALFTFAYLRYRSGKVHLHSRDIYKE